MNRTVVAVALMLPVAGCGGSTGTRVDRFGLPLDRPVTQQELRRIPDATLLFPGSKVVRAIGSDERKQAGEHEPDPAFAGSIAVVPATVDTLLAWYDHQLLPRGYRRATYYKLAGQSTGRAWTAPGNREQVQVGIYAAGSPLPGKPVPGKVPTGRVGYEIVFVNYRVTGPPPS
jgi:hypothetical protein